VVCFCCPDVAEKLRKTNRPHYRIYKPEGEPTFEQKCHENLKNNIIENNIIKIVYL
jgi:hypothetical protein